jgi:hypothetical protein
MLTVGGVGMPKTTENTSQLCITRLAIRPRLSLQSTTPPDRPSPNEKAPDYAESTYLNLDWLKIISPALSSFTQRKIAFNSHVFRLKVLRAMACGIRRVESVH